MAAAEARQLRSVARPPIETSGVADPREVRDWAENLPGKFLICRDLNHDWSGYRAWATGRGRSLLYTRVLKCKKCTTEREDTLTSQGFKVGTKYNYPDGYLTPKGTGRLGSDARAALRLVSVISHLGERPVEVPA